MRTFILLLVLGLPVFSGCTIINNIDEITTLSQYSREKDNQHRLVQAIDDHYDALTRAIIQGHVSEYKDKTFFIHSFGEPILKKNLSNGQERWLYRYAIDRLAKTKVYVYFDRKGALVRWEKLPCPKLF